uniref:Uncharacterized protein n=1 Tax=Timema bartmani TaxID=61472 RepID=A0A7R9F1T6_9NEOP|nr:unnamed protein product [Timema bartmani]
MNKKTPAFPSLLSPIIPQPSETAAAQLLNKKEDIENREAVRVVNRNYHRIMSTSLVISKLPQFLSSLGRSSYVALKMWGRNSTVSLELVNLSRKHGRQQINYKAQCRFPRNNLPRERDNVLLSLSVSLGDTACPSLFICCDVRCTLAPLTDRKYNYHATLHCKTVAGSSRDRATQNDKIFWRWNFLLSKDLTKSLENGNVFSKRSPSSEARVPFTPIDLKAPSYGNWTISTVHYLGDKELLTSCYTVGSNWSRTPDPWTLNSCGVSQTSKKYESSFSVLNKDSRCRIFSSTSKTNIIQFEVRFHLSFPEAFKYAEEWIIPLDVERHEKLSLERLNCRQMAKYCLDSRIFLSWSSAQELAGEEHDVTYDS